MTRSPSSTSTWTSSRARSTCCSRCCCARRSASPRWSSARSSLAYIDHLEGRGELDLEAVTEFLVLIAALLELKSRLLLPGRGRRARARARGGRRRAARADARVPPLPRRGRGAGGAVRARAAEHLPLGATAAGAAPRRGEGGGQGLRARPARLGAGRPAQRCRPTPTPATSAPRSRCSGGSRSSASC